MAVALTTIADTKYRTTVKVIVSSTNSAASILDVSGLEAWQAGSLVNIAKIFWSTAGGNITLSFLGTGAHTGIEVAPTGAGQYGYQPGQPALPNATTGGATQGNVGFTNATAATGTLVIEYHKIPDSNGRGWGG